MCVAEAQLPSEHLELGHLHRGNEACGSRQRLRILLLLLQQLPLLQVMREASVQRLRWWRWLPFACTMCAACHNLRRVQQRLRERVGAAAGAFERGRHSEAHGYAGGGALQLPGLCNLRFCCCCC